MPTRNVVLTEHQDIMIDALIHTGRYQNASEVLRAGLRLVDTFEKQEAAKLEALRSALKIGVEAFERGEFKEFSDTAAMVQYLDNIAELN
jgi:antitoxin ParD1/3/4